MEWRAATAAWGRSAPADFTRRLRNLGSHTVTATSVALTTYSVNASVSVINAPTGTVSVLTYHNDDVRDGANLSETVLNTSNINQSQFGKLFALQVDAQVYAQPLYRAEPEHWRSPSQRGVRCHGKRHGVCLRRRWSLRFATVEAASRNSHSGKRLRKESSRCWESPRPR